MITGAIICFNEARFIRGAIFSLQKYVDRILVVDGAYENFPHRDPRSTDGTIEIAEKAGAEVIRNHTAWKSQIDKRNKYLELCGPGDQILHLDCDERLVCDKKIGLRFLKGHIAYRINVSDPPYKDNAWIRFFDWSENLRYKGAHNLLFRGDNLIKPEYCPILHGISVDHIKHMRSTVRKRDCATYYKIQYEQERAFRLEHGTP